MVLRLSVYTVLAANWPLWLQLARIGGAPSLYMRSAAALAVLIACGMVAVFAFLAWTRGMKLLWWLVVLVAALSQYYMLTYSVVMDPGMAANVLQTDAHEVADLLSLRMLLAVLAVLLLPTWWLLRVRIPAMRPLRRAWRNLAMLALALGVAAGTVAATSRDTAPLMRNHSQLRYLMNPLASLYSTTVSAMQPVFARSRTLVPMTQGAALGDSYAAAAGPAFRPGGGRDGSGRPFRHQRLWPRHHAGTGQARRDELARRALVRHEHAGLAAVHVLAAGQERVRVAQRRV